MPGIGKVLALTILFEIDTVERFPTVKDFVSYCRLVKGSAASAGKLKGLYGGKMGNPYLRRAFGQAAVICKCNHPLLTPYAEMLVSKHGKYKANAVLANKLGRSFAMQPTAALRESGVAFRLPPHPRKTPDPQATYRYSFIKRTDGICRLSTPSNYAGANAAPDRENP